MDTGRLTVFFEDPFWVGVFERISDGKLSACRVIFGAEPRDCEVWDFILKRYDGLKFSPTVAVEGRQTADHPKRRASGVGTKSQQALQMQREERKTQRKQRGKERQNAEKQRRFDLKQQKRKAKRRGH